MDDLATLGLILQLAGTLLAAGALVAEGRSRSVRGALPGLPRARDPWKEESRVRKPNVSRRSLRDWQAKVRGSGPMIALGGHYGQPGSDPELLAFAEWIVLTNQETREKLATDWHRQDTALRELFEANNALFEALQAQQASTRRRVVVEMGGLVIVAIGTVLSTLPTSAAGG